MIKKLKMVFFIGVFLVFSFCLFSLPFNTVSSSAESANPLTPFYQTGNYFQGNEQFNDDEITRTNFYLRYDGQSGIFKTNETTAVPSSEVLFDLGVVKRGSYSADTGFYIFITSNYQLPEAFTLCISYNVNNTLQIYTCGSLADYQSFFIDELPSNDNYDMYLTLRIGDDLVLDEYDYNFRIMVNNVLSPYCMNYEEYLLFNSSLIAEPYNKGYEDGYNAGFSVNTTNFYNQGYKDGSNLGYNLGYTDGINHADEFSFSRAVSVVLSSPIIITKEFLNFEILGFNMLGFFTGLITLIIVVKCVKAFI